MAQYIWFSQYYILSWNLDLFQYISNAHSFVIILWNGMWKKEEFKYVKEKLFAREKKNISQLYWSRHILDFSGKKKILETVADSLTIRLWTPDTKEVRKIEIYFDGKIYGVRRINHTIYFVYLIFFFVVVIIIINRYKNRVLLLFAMNWALMIWNCSSKFITTDNLTGAYNCCDEVKSRKNLHFALSLPIFHIETKRFMCDTSI